MHSNNDNNNNTNHLRHSRSFVWWNVSFADVLLARNYLWLRSNFRWSWNLPIDKFRFYVQLFRF